MERDSFAPEFLTVAQVAQLAGVSTKTVMRALWARELRGQQRKTNGKWHIRVEDYDRWMRGQVPVRRSA